MYVLNIPDDYDSFTNCTDNENDDFNVIRNSFISINLGGALLISLISLIKWTTLTTLTTTLKWINFNTHSNQFAVLLQHFLNVEIQIFY